MRQIVSLHSNAMYFVRGRVLTMIFLSKVFVKSFFQKRQTSFVDFAKKDLTPIQDT